MGVRKMDIRKFTTRNGAVLPFSVVGLGAAPIGDLYEKLDEKTAISTVEAAHQAGVTIFDTSPHYGNGLSESRIGAGLRSAKRDSYLISTKVARVMNPFAKPARALPVGFLMRQVLIIRAMVRCGRLNNHCCGWDLIGSISF
jgi:aryl-alcohol dehydrogenase-like predicted oxidoreductase